MKHLVTILLMLLMLCALAPAQQKALLDELKGIEAFRADKLGELTLFVSKKADVERVMGKSRHSTYEYDANWRIHFGYVGNWGKKVDGQYYKPKAESLGKLSHIWFFAKASFMIKSLDDLPVGVTCRDSNGVHEAPAIKNRICTDRDKRISFYIAAETTADGKYVDGKLVRINYMAKQADHDAIWEIIPK